MVLIFWSFLKPYGFQKVYIVLNETICMENVKFNGINFNEAYQKVLLWFFLFPNNKISLTELTKKLKISKTTANKIVKDLEKEGFLKIEIVGKSWQIFLNSEYDISKKISYNLMMIMDTNIIEKTYEKIPNALAIILFGSYRKGDDIPESDIDIAVEVAGIQPLKIINLGIIRSFGYRKNVPVRLHVFSRNKIDINLFSNIANGFVLDGFLEVKK